jgi:hypothetical protein
MKVILWLYPEIRVLLFAATVLTAVVNICIFPPRHSTVLGCAVVWSQILSGDGYKNGKLQLLVDKS